MNKFGVFVGPESIGLAAVGEHMLGISKIAVGQAGLGLACRTVLKMMERMLALSVVVG